MSYRNLTINKSFYCLFLCALLYACDPIDSRLTVINKTNKTLVVSPRLYSVDTLNYKENRGSVDNVEFIEYKVSPNDTLKMSRKDSWNNLLVINNSMVLLILQ